MRFEPSREASKLMKKRVRKKRYNKTRIFYENVPKSVKMGCPFRRENLLCASLFATWAPKVAQRGPKGGPGRPRVLKMMKKRPKWCQFFQFCPKPPTASGGIRMHPNLSEQIRMDPDRSKNFRKFAKTCENFGKS